jgi:hypothetical protein
MPYSSSIHSRVKPIRDYLMKSKKRKNYIEYEFHKWRKPLLIIDIVFSIIVLFLTFIFKSEFILITTFFLIIVYLIISDRKKFFYHFLTASIVATLWMIVAKKEYGYNHDFITILGYNAFPLFSWAIGLFCVYVLYSYLEHLFHEDGFIKKFILFTILFIPILLIAETLGYHVFDIHNIATAKYTPLPICNCIHAPWWMQLSYILLGPIYFIICYLLNLENPHYKVKRKKY